MRRAYLPALDGLRGIAVLLVLWTHVPLDTQGYPEWLAMLVGRLEPGYLGVELFFVLSGFLITRILLVERDAGRSLGWFLLRRSLRIFPTYYLLLAVVAVVAPGPEWPWCAAYLGNFWFAAHPTASPLRHTWSLCIEEHFYLVWPWVVSWLRPAHLGPLLVLGILPGAVVAAWTACALSPPEQLPTVLQYETWYRSLALAAGSLLALVERRRAAEPAAPQPGPFVSARFGRRRLQGLAGALLGLAFLLSETHLGILLPTGYAPLSGAYTPVLPLHYLPACKLVSFTLACTALLMLAANAKPHGRPARWLASAPLRAIGRISYGLYLYHYPIYHALLGPAPTAARAGLAIVVSFVVATVSYTCLERPILTFAARYR